MTSDTMQQRQIEVPLIDRGNISATIDIPESLTVLEDGQSRENGQCQFSVLTIKDGDKRVIWDKRDMAQIQDAKKMFNELVAKGLAPYSVGVDGKASAQVISEFDPLAEEIIFLPIRLVKGG